MVGVELFGGWRGGAVARKPFFIGGSEQVGINQYVGWGLGIYSSPSITDISDKNSSNCRQFAIHHISTTYEFSDQCSKLFQNDHEFNTNHKCLSFCKLVRYL